MDNKIPKYNGDAPCFKCAERKFGCHDSCVRYKAFTEKTRKNNERNRHMAWTARMY